MNGTVTQFKDISMSRIFESTTIVVGRIDRINRDGRALVDFPGNPSGPVLARSVIQIPEEPSRFDSITIPALVVFENGDPQRPIIVGLIRDTILPHITTQGESTAFADDQRDIFLDGEKMIFDAKREIVLRCGKSSITLKKDGKIVVKGTRITNRASETNKIKGASVLIN